MQRPFDSDLANPLLTQLGSTQDGYYPSISPHGPSGSPPSPLDPSPQGHLPASADASYQGRLNDWDVPENEKLVLEKADSLELSKTQLEIKESTEKPIENNLDTVTNPALHNGSNGTTKGTANGNIESQESTADGNGDGHGADGHGDNGHGDNGHGDSAPGENGHGDNGHGDNGHGTVPAIAPFPELSEEIEHGFLPVLRNQNFLALWSGQVFSQLADKVYLVLMIMIITSRFQTADQTVSGWVSSIMIAFTIPAVLFGSVAGVFVDHWSKKLVLVATNLMRGGLVLALPIFLWLSQGWAPVNDTPVGFLALLTVTFLVSTLTQFFAPAEQAVIPLLVERRHLLSANSLYTTTMMASVIIGFAVGEPLLGFADQVLAGLLPRFGDFGLGKELLVGGSYVVAGLLLLLIRTRKNSDLSKDDLPDVWGNIRDGLKYLGEKPRVRAAFLQLVILFSIFAALSVLAVRLAEVMVALKSSQFGFLLAAGGVGMGIGAVGVGHYGQRFSRAQLSLYGSIGMAASLTTLSFFTQQLVPTLIVLVCLGMASALVGVPMQTAIQEETLEEMRGKVFGLQNNAINIALSLPLALAGVAENWLGLQAVFLGLAGLAIAGGLITHSLLKSSQSSSHE